VLQGRKRKAWKKKLRQIVNKSPKLMKNSTMHRLRNLAPCTTHTHTHTETLVWIFSAKDLFKSVAGRGLDRFRIKKRRFVDQKVSCFPKNISKSFRTNSVASSSGPKLLAFPEVELSNYFNLLITFLKVIILVRKFGRTRGTGTNRLIAWI
jgi:hypothetical protein